MTRFVAAAITLAALVSLAACAQPREAGTLSVPGDYPKIQAAVDAAVPGDLILIDPGTYEEEVRVEVEDVTIRGVDRNTVVLAGGHTLRSGFIVTADGVSI